MVKQAQCGMCKSLVPAFISLCPVCGTDGADHAHPPVPSPLSKALATVGSGIPRPIGSRDLFLPNGTIGQS
jgi:hypothetical protein